VSAAVGAGELASVPLFAALSPDQLQHLVAAADRLSLRAGEWLFHEGDAGDGLYVVTAGSVDVVAGAPDSRVVRTLGRGESIGELALLTGKPRSLGARAHRDCQLARISRDALETVLLSEPQLGLALMRLLGERLRAVRAPSEEGPSRPRIIGLLPLHPGAPVGTVADLLASALEELGRLARLDPAEPVPLDVLDRLEADHDRVLLVATDPAPANPWTDYCLRQSDLVVGVASKPHDAAAEAAAARLRGCEVAFVAPDGVEPELEGWLDALEAGTTHILRAGSPAAGARRMARRLAGRSLGVVLSGGGARGLAHVGVIEELQRAGYEIDRIGGASMGAMIGSLFAEGRSADEAMEVMEAEYVRSTPLKGRTIPLAALSRGIRGLNAQLRLHGGRRIEGLDVNFFCVSADLVLQRLVVHRRGLVAVAVSASQALPAFVPPVKDGDRMLVDGGILNNLPVHPMLATGEGPILAVDVTGALPPPRAPRSRFPALRRWIVGPAAEWAPPITETILRSVLLGNALTDAAARERADVVIRPNLRGVPTMRFKELESVRRAGQEAARKAIEEGRMSPLGVAPGG
jgi:predicted acylesterase/phospholipase RssA/CRP-like cAMP-binding protein